MKSILSATVCAAALAVAIPALAATEDAPMHHRHHMHGKHSGMMRKGKSGGDAETAKLNEQSLANAKSGVMPASGSTSGMAPNGSGMAPTGSGMAPNGSGMSAPGNAMAPSGGGTGMSAPGTGMGPSSTSTAPSASGAMAAPGTGMSAPASGAMGNAMPGNAPAATTTPEGK